MSENPLAWVLRILLIKDFTQNPVEDTPIKVVSKTAPDSEVCGRQGDSEKPTSQARLSSSWYTTQSLPHP